MKNPVQKMTEAGQRLQRAMDARNEPEARFALAAIQSLVLELQGDDVSGFTPSDLRALLELNRRAYLDYPPAEGTPEALRMKNLIGLIEAELERRGKHRKRRRGP